MRSDFGRRAIRAAVFGISLIPVLAAAARSDGRTWWDEKRRDYPQCASLTNQHERLTDELDRLAETARPAVEPQRAAILRQLNATAATRNRVQDQLFACIRQTAGAPGPAASNGQPPRPPLQGGVQETGQPPATQPPAGPGVPPGAGVPPGGGFPPSGGFPPGGGFPPSGGYPPPGGGSPGGVPGGSPGGIPGGTPGGWPGATPQPPARPPAQPPSGPRPGAPDPAAYVQGLLEGMASCFAGVIVGPIQQIWTDAGIYARFTSALLHGDADTAASILQIKGERDRRNFDSFVKSLNPNVYNVRPIEAGRRDGSRLCMFGIIPGGARAAAGRPRPTPGAGAPPATGGAAAGAALGGTRALLADLSWLRGLNPTRCRFNCSNSAIMVDQILAGKPVLPAMPSPGMMPATAELFYGRNFGPRMLPDFVQATMRNRGDLARAILRADSGPGTPGHQLNVVMDGATLRLLDGQAGRAVTFGDLARWGFTEFQLLHTN